MIEINQEKLIPLSEVPKRLPPRPSGRRVHVSAVYRWVQRGVRGVPSALDRSFGLQDDAQRTTGSADSRQPADQPGAGGPGDRLPSSGDRAGDCGRPPALG